MKQFTQTLAEMRFGETQGELTKALQQMVAAVAMTNKAGQLTLKMKFKPGPGGSIEVSDDIDLKLPSLPRGTSLFFANVDNSLTRNNPKQDELPGLKAVEKVDTSTGEVTKVA